MLGRLLHLGTDTCGSVAQLSTAVPASVPKDAGGSSHGYAIVETAKADVLHILVLASAIHSVIVQLQQP